MTTSTNDFALRVERFKATAKESGVKLTHQRLEIFREVAARVDHPDAETVFRAVRKKMQTVSLDTVYRTLWMLSDLGLITTLGARRENVRFDANLEHHHHYICVHCGLTRDFKSSDLDALQVPAAARGFGSILGAHVEIRGICGKCANGSTVKSRKRDPGKPRRNRRKKA